MGGKPAKELETLRRRIVELEQAETERKQTEVELKESEEKLRLMFGSVTDGIMVTDLNGVIVELNDRIVEMDGFVSKR